MYIRDIQVIKEKASGTPAPRPVANTIQANSCYKATIAAEPAITMSNPETIPTPRSPLLQPLLSALRAARRRA
jgi:hypothetical protein